MDAYVTPGFMLSFYDNRQVQKRFWKNQKRLSKECLH